MTTVAANLKCMAADAQCTYSPLGGGVARVQKIYTIKGSIFGASGNLDNALRALAWIRRGCKGPEPEFSDDRSDQFDMLELCPAGLFLWSNSLVRAQLFEEYAALGSGGDVAYYVMAKRGGTPVQAVEEACSVDLFSSGPIQTVTLDEVKAYADKTPERRPSARSSRRR